MLLRRHSKVIWKTSIWRCISRWVSCCTFVQSIFPIYFRDYLDFSVHPDLPVPLFLAIAPTVFLSLVWLCAPPRALFQHLLTFLQILAGIIIQIRGVECGYIISKSINRHGQLLDSPADSLCGHYLPAKRYHWVSTSKCYSFNSANPHQLGWFRWRWV